MGILITKQHDQEAYNELIEEINNIKVNGNRIRFDGKSEVQTAVKNIIEKKEVAVKETPIAANIQLTPQQKLKFQLLKQWRLEKSREENVRAFQILTDNEIRNIVLKEKLEAKVLYDIVAKKNAIKYGSQILERLKYIDYYTIGKVTNVWYQDNPTSYDRVKLKIAGSNEERWFDTTQELPNIDSLVAAKINRSWFNEYIYLDED